MTTVDRSSTRQAVALRWLNEGRRVVAATLIQTLGSAPLDPGAEMLVDDIGRIEGSVTGGCVEGALVELAAEMLRDGGPRIVEYGISDGEAADVGLMCGGVVRLFVHELREETHAALRAVVDALEADMPIALATVLDGQAAGAKLAVSAERVVGRLHGIERLERSVAHEAVGFLDQGLSTIRHYSMSGEVMGSELGVYIQGFASPPQMVIFGAIDFSTALAELAHGLGYKVTICDARAPFLSSERFAAVAEVVVDWPQRHIAEREFQSRDAILVFTHDPKFDEPALISALESGAGYIGALGSRRTHQDRLTRLREAGVSETQMARISAPCGLDIGARTPAETAISVLAEIISQRTGRRGRPLSEMRGPIHPPNLHGN